MIGVAKSVTCKRTVIPARGGEHKLCRAPKGTMALTRDPQEKIVPLARKGAAQKFVRSGRGGRIHGAWP